MRKTRALHHLVGRRREFASLGGCFVVGVVFLHPLQELVERHFVRMSFNIDGVVGQIDDRDDVLGRPNADAEPRQNPSGLR